jgi:hypothetical protein
MKSLSFALPAVVILASLAITPVAARQRAMEPRDSANTFANAAGNSSRMALEHHACAVIMGLHQPGDPLRYMHQKPQKEFVRIG